MSDWGVLFGLLSTPIFLQIDNDATSRYTIYLEGGSRIVLTRQLLLPWLLWYFTNE